ncbi:MAG: hypothetical protein IIA05_10425 [Proteobacteria bacterium]|nr:hypothetical protein [Pseudomonadota bacterium]
MPKRSILLLLCTIFVLSIGLSATGYAKKPENGNGKGNGKPDKSGTSCEINFCIDFADSHEVTSDGFDGGEYCHGTDKVLVFTGNGPGFGFDTMQSGKGKSMTRYLNINIDVADSGIRALQKKVVLKFDKSGDPSGLDLCSLDSESVSGGQEGMVGLAISYKVDGATDNSNTLTYGAPAGAPCGTKVTVTRINDGTWTIAATKACLWDGQKDALVFKGSVNREIIDDDVDASFFATITEIQ